MKMLDRLIAETKEGVILLSAIGEASGGSGLGDAA